MKKVKFLKTTDRWFKGEVVDLPKHEADAAIKAKVAERYKQPAAKEIEVKPENEK